MTNRDFDNAIYFEDKMPSDAASFIGAFRAVELCRLACAKYYGQIPKLANLSPFHRVVELLCSRLV